MLNIQVVSCLRELRIISELSADRRQGLVLCRAIYLRRGKGGFEGGVCVEVGGWRGPGEKSKAKGRRFLGVW